MTTIRKHKHNNLYIITLSDGSERLATINADPGNKVYGERLIKGEDNIEYRTFDPYRSKLAAAISMDLKTFMFKEGANVLYLGAASGTTVSHVSDLIGETGIVYAIEFSARSTRDLIRLSESRSNIAPLLSDARYPEEYSFVVHPVDIIFEDVAQPIQTEILRNNIESFLKDDGVFYLAVKARSIDVTKDPKEIFKEVIHDLKSYGYEIIETVDLEPYEKDHMMIVGKK